jgi:hypothetical protein
MSFWKAQRHFSGRIHDDDNWLHIVERNRLSRYRYDSGGGGMPDVYYADESTDYSEKNHDSNQC